MRLKIETSRLILRPFELTEAEEAFGWFGDPVVMRFTPTGPDTSIGQTKTRLAKYQEHQIAHGFSKWVIVDRSTGRSIGDSGLLDELSLDRLTALVHPENAASIRVLSKLKFRVVRQDTIMGMNSILFTLDAKAA